MAEYILQKDSLFSAYPKINASIQQSEDALSESGRAIDNSNQAVNTANQTQQQIDNLILSDGTSDAEVVQARGSYGLLYNRFQANESQLADIAKLNVIDITKPPKPLSGVVADSVADNTVAIQTIIDYAKDNNYEGIYIPYSLSKYMIKVNQTGTNTHTGNGLQIPSNFKFIIHPDTTLKAIDTVETFQVMLNVYNAKNVLIMGGTLEGERESHAGFVNQYGYGLYIHGSENVEVIDTISKDWWGDCFNTRDIDTNSANNFLQPCRNITFDNVTADNGCRQGLSVISGKGVQILHSTFKNTNGTSPQAGIDLEPNYIDVAKKLENIIVDNCTFINNTGDSIVASNTINLTVNNSNLNDSEIYLVDSVSNVKITENNFSNARVVSYGENVVIKDNTFNGGASAFYISNLYDDPVLVVGNKVYNCVTAIVLQDGGNIDFINNHIYNSSTRPVIMNSNLTNVRFIGNHFEGNLGMFYIKLIDSLISSNTFINNEYSLYHTGGGSTVIQDNVFWVTDNSAVNFITVGSGIEGSVVEGNKMYAKATDSVEPISITANANRVVPIIMKGNISFKTTTIFATPPAGVVSENNYSS